MAGELLTITKSSKGVERLCDAITGAKSTHLLEGLTGGALPVYAAQSIKRCVGCHIFIAEDRDSAAYLLNDLYALLDESRVYFFPSSYKRSVAVGGEDAEAVVQRTATLTALRGAAERSGAAGAAGAAGAGKREYVVVVTYPEAIAERVVRQETMQCSLISVGVGDTLSVEFLQEALIDAAFERVDFVYEPGQYSIRGGIIDIFSYSESRPYRIDMFGDEVESIRRFNISSQLSTERLERVDIVPRLEAGGDSSMVSIVEFAGVDARLWLYDADFVVRRVDEVHKKVNKDIVLSSERGAKIMGAEELLKSIESNQIFLLRDTLAKRKADAKIEFSTTPQPKFNKNFEMLADDLIRNTLRGYATYILSENRLQIERLENIFHQIGRGQVEIKSLPLTLHEGFVDNDMKVCLYTDHQIFDRYQRYRINGGLKRDEQMTIAELNELRVGDYVVHIDHGVGRFDGLIKLNEGGKMREAIKLVYSGGDVLFVNIHSLHRISRYKSGDGEPPKVYKLGGGAWAKIKNATKKAVKDISRELIALYAKRKASEGFAFSEDGYLQQELEASFEWEPTPDQESTVEAVKRDMESTQPMDRLVCGDVGFGKTEVAMRAAFKAVTDGKQVAVLVPTTILAMQHYRSFSRRMRDFPVRIEYINRKRSAKDLKQIAEELKAGRIDILIGTHKMLGKGIEFRDLGLFIVDEEQKFGVAAKEKLTQMRVSVDTLTLTATPIPRTLQFSIMGSRDLSVISTPPPNRQPIQTESHAFSEDIIREAIDFELQRGGQVYFIHNKIDDMLTIQGMITRLCPTARVGVGHGRLTAEKLEKLIMDFIYGEFDVLLSTTIVENGIDIPNANTIIIDGAQNFGLSDLHQLRGRVGRSDRKGYCYLLSPPDELLTQDARRRLRAIEEFSDLGSGFNIAMQDLDIRGAGNLLGAEQSGFIADIGFETYQKIMNEAIAELRAEGLDVASMSDEEQGVVNKISFVDDAHIDVDVEVGLPDAYVSYQAERLKLYRELDSLSSEEELQGFESRLVDRFGALPEPTKELLDVVRLRWEAIRLGVERVKVKNGLMILHFVGDNSSPLFQSDTFRTMLQRVTQNPNRFVLKQHNNHLAMTVRQIGGITDGYKTLRAL